MANVKKNNVVKKAFEEQQEKIIKKVKEASEAAEGNVVITEEQFDTITITIKRKKDDLICKCKNSMYSGFVVNKDYFTKPHSENEKKDIIRNMADNSLKIFFDEDKRRRINMYFPKNGNGYCRFNTISDTFKEEDLCWRTFDSDSIDCLKDLESGNVYRDGHEARSDFYRMKNDLLQKRKQIIEKLNKVDTDEED